MRSTYSQLSGTASRRVLATRDTDWARSVARVMAGTGVRPNGVSVAGVAFALAAATAFVVSPALEPGRARRAAARCRRMHPAATVVQSARWNARRRGRPQDP